MDAVRNNAEWCDTVCRAQGIPTRFDDHVWVSLRRSPPFYPDAVTLTRSASAGEVLHDIDTSSGCSVKDSFANLDLAPHGFRILFDAEWIYLTAPPGTGDPVWTVVSDPADFGAWETGAVFRPVLLNNPDVTFLLEQGGDERGGRGGVIANRTGPVVGLSNLFGGSTGTADWPAAVRSIAARYPGLPIVGYQSGDELAAARRAGFTSTGPLRVWIKD
jgi:hypothetical protein